MPALPFSSPVRPRADTGNRPTRWPVAPALLLACLAAGCGPKDNEFPACPGLALVPDAGDLSRFNGHGQDITDLVLRARINAVPAMCEPGKPGMVNATLHVEAEITRGIAAASGTPPVIYFIALMQNDRVLEEKDYQLTPAFASNVESARVSGDDIELFLPVGKNKSAAAYRIFVGFRLTPDEFTYNRTHQHP